MREKRKNRLSDEIRDLAARFLEKESSRTALITVTRAELSKDGEGLTVFISVYPPEREKQALEFARRKVGTLREFVADEMKTKTIPRFVIEIDTGEKNRQKIEELFKKL